MIENNYSSPRSLAPNTWRGLLILLGFILIGTSVGNLAAMLAVSVIWSDGGFSASMISTLISTPEKIPYGWFALMVLQSIVHVFTFLLPALLYWRWIERRQFQNFRFRRDPEPFTWLLVFVLVIIFIPLNSVFIEWNASMQLPPFLKEIEEWMRSKEDQLLKMTLFMTKFESLSQLFIAIVVIALIPAIGEEVLFRGILQRKLAESWSNVHLSIWASAFVFSAIHFQFYGFLPRLLLGALFGYLYYWTGRLSIAIFAHFVNNGFTVVLLYLYHIKVIETNIEEKAMPLATSLLSLVLSAAILYTLRKQSLISLKN
jgi:membrane protease YdiL (CAAX protease family)